MMEGVAEGSRQGAYWLVGFALGLVVMGSNIPSPLYSIYQQKWDFSAGVLTLIFAVYALSLIPTLLVFGNLSDEVGRRRVVISGLLAIAVGSSLFFLAQGVAWLFAARIVQGIAVGIISGAASAALAELHPREDRRAAALTTTVALAGGSAVGPLFGGLITQYSPYPLLLPYLVHLGISVLAACGIFAVMPETVAAEARGSWKPRRPHIPSDIRYPFTVGSAACFCGWAAGGLFLALVPSYAAAVLQVHSLVAGGGAVSVMFGCACAVQVALRNLSPRRAMVRGMAALLAGLAAMVVAVPLHSIWLLLAGALLDGAGLGLAFMCGLGLVGRVAPPESKAETISACYVVTYLGLSLPVVGVGFAAGALGLFASVAAFAAVMVIPALFVALSASKVQRLS